MGEDIILLPGQEGFVYKGPTYQELNKKLKSNPLVYNQIQQNIARKNNPTKEIVSYVDANGNTQHTTNVAAGVLSPVDPLAEFYVAGKVLNPVFKVAGRAGEYGMARLGNNWARARILSRNMTSTPQNVNKVNTYFRNEEWKNLLNIINGDNYYRLEGFNSIIKNPKEKYFVSHTTPWEEFTGLKYITENPEVDISNEILGIKKLYEFPTKTFGKRKYSSYKGILGDVDVSEMGKLHLMYGNTSSGSRDLVRVLSDKNAEKLGVEPFRIGIKDRPLNKFGLYDSNPIYEDIYSGYQTTISGKELQDAINNSIYYLYKPTKNGVQKILHVSK